ncbi:MAG: DUF1684 domain-containing protein [Salibacteraceae bacterium]
MKLSVFLIAMLSFTMAYSQGNYIAEIQDQRAEKDKTLQSRRTSPLQRKDRRRFQDLPYYEIDEIWRIEVDLKRTESDEIIEIPTSAGYAKKFKEYGVLELFIGENYFPLTAYVRVPRDGEEPADHQSLFVPFKDLTSGNATYGGGRYLDVEIPTGDNPAIVDFNLAYSPYCAYGGGFACPIPPQKNFIKAEVRAGEKALEHH